MNVVGDCFDERFVTCTCSNSTCSYQCKVYKLNCVLFCLGKNLFDFPSYLCNRCSSLCCGKYN